MHGSGGRSVGGGGVIKLTVPGKLTVNGRIDADASNFSGGGRVAIYLTEATSFAGCGVSINAYGGRMQSSIAGQRPTTPCGTVYLQTAAEADGCGRIVLDNDDSTSVSRGTELPARSGDEDKSAFKGVSLVLRNSGVLSLENDMKVNDVFVETGSAKFLLKDHILSVASMEHCNGLGWRGETNKKKAKAYVDSICDKGTEGRGEIAWPRPGLMLMVR